ncbi:hypothetical protein KFE25_000782 [Diacronema lutheri]|uniref:Transcription factor CBF/NF-Y/archaeal histone domain-containing protein n=2 Tax=Diacronema lutheri TaxID=2081491 RepID=A0A8J6CDU6_DIALT|nr:hypothetical protein KFE25_000782 [Diacronema lutheri]
MGIGERRARAATSDARRPRKARAARPRARASGGATAVVLASAGVAHDERASASIELALPISRVSRVIRTDKDVNKVNRDALFAIAKCTEVFIGTLAQQSAAAVGQSHRKTIQYKDFTDVLLAQPNASVLQFLTDELGVDAPAPGRAT